MAAANTKNANSKAKAKAMTKTDFKQKIADQIGISTKQAGQVIDLLQTVAVEQVRKVGVFALPGLVKITKVVKPATKAGTKPNPFKPGEMMEVKARPARNVVKVRALKNLKDAVA